MQLFEWDSDKNERLKQERGISFEEVIYSLFNGGLVDIVQNPNSKKYQLQKIMYVTVKNYVYAVPCVETEENIFLKTVFPSRKATKKYLDKE